MEVLIQQSVYRIREHHDHADTAQDVGIDRKHTERPKSHMIKIDIINSGQIPGHTDADADRYGHRTDQCTNACFT